MAAIASLVPLTLHPQTMSNLSSSFSGCSSVGHPNEDVLKVIIDALAMLLKAHPKQALWHLSSLCLSISDTRRQVSRWMVRMWEYNNT